MEEASRYHLIGTRCRIGSNKPERFNTFVIATGYVDAQKAARWNWSGEWHTVIFNRVAQFPKAPQ